MPFNVDNDDFDAKAYFKGHEFEDITMQSEWEPSAPSKSVVCIDSQEYNTRGEMHDFDYIVTDIWSCERC